MIGLDTNVLSVLTRAFLLGPAVDHYREPRLSRYGIVLLALGLAAIPLSYNYVGLAMAIALIPLGTAFTFPCETGMLSQVIPNHERGLYMGVQQTFGGVARVGGGRRTRGCVVRRMWPCLVVRPTWCAARRVRNAG